MSLSPEQVIKIANLARIAIDTQAIPRYAENLSDILAFVEQMNRVDTSGILPMAHPLEAVARCRTDEVTETDHREQFQCIAPQVEAGLYLVPKVIE